jgi:hypothetical protein
MSFLRLSRAPPVDPAFVNKLNSLFVAVNPIFPAEHPGSFDLPIFGGTISPDGSLGRVETKGSLEIPAARRRPGLLA